MSVDETLKDDYQKKDRCLRLLSASVGGVEAVRQLKEVADIEAQIATHHIRGEVGFLRGEQALALGLLDAAIGALTAAKSAYLLETQGIPRRIGECWILLARAYEARLLRSEAVSAMRSALEVLREWDDAEAYTRQLEVIAKIARLLNRIGDPLAARSELDAARNLEFEYFGLPTDRAQFMMHLIKAETLVVRGQFQRASMVLNALDEPEGVRERADLADARGYVAASAGQSADAARHYRVAADSYRVAMEHASDSELATSSATSTMNLAAALGAEGDHRSALACYQTALELLEAYSLDSVGRAECRLNLAGQAIAGGDLAAAEAYLDLVSEFLSNVDGFAYLRAGLATNLGLVAHRRGDRTRAAEWHRDAHRLFLTDSSPEWAARAAINQAIVIGLGQDQIERDQALELLIPALIYLEHMRFQFPTPQARQSWREPIARAYEFAFDLAGDDSRLVSELIENAINAGSHCANQLVAEDDSGALFRKGSGNLQAVNVAGPQSHSGVGRLVAGAVLPMRPPPRILLPDGKTVALERFYMRSAVYGDIPYASDRLIAVAPSDA